MVSIVETACERTEELGYSRVALLGTYPTMTGTFFQKTFAAHSIEVVTPMEAEMRYIGEKIETELELVQVIPETWRRFCEIAERIAAERQA